MFLRCVLVTSCLVIAMSQVQALTDTGNGVVFIPSSKNLGIGYILPTRKLDVNGSTFTKSFTLNGSALSLTQGSLLYSKVAGSAAMLPRGSDHYALKVNGNTLAWESAASSDSLDGIDSTSFLRSDTSDNYTFGTLTLNAGTTFDINSTAVSIADTVIDFDGTSTTFNGTTGAMTLRPAAGTNLNVSLSTTGDFAVNTNQLYVDTSAANVGIGIIAPTSKLHVNGTTFTKGFALNGSALSLAQGSLLYSQVAGSAAMLPRGTNHYALKVNGNTLVWESAASSDTLDGIDSTSFLRSDTSDNYSSGVLTLDAGTTFDINSTAVSIADPNIAFDGATTTFNGTGAMTLKPGAGTNLNISLSTTGDFAVNTNQLYVDTSAARVGIGDSTPSAALDVGSGTPTHIDGTNDVLIADDLEVDGTIFANKFNGGTFNGTFLGDGSGLSGVGTPPAAGTGRIQFNTAGAFDSNGQLFWRSNAATLGVGNNNPQYKLHVSSAAAAVVAVQNTLDEANWQEFRTLGVNGTGASVPKWSMGSFGDARTDLENLFYIYQFTDKNDNFIHHSIPAEGQFRMAINDNGYFAFGYSYLDTYNFNYPFNFNGQAMFNHGLYANGDIIAKKSYVQESEYNNTTDTIDWNRGNQQSKTLGAPTTTLTFTAPSGPTRLVLILIQDGTGSRTVTWPANVKWPSATAPTLTITAGRIDVISCIYRSSPDLYLCVPSLDFTP